MKTFDFEEELRRMGKGWFVLRVAEECGISIPTSTTYGSTLAMRTRNSRFEYTIDYHKDMIDYLKKNWSTRITGGNPVVSNDVLLDLVNKILGI